jgi:hypothetical protein
MGKISVSIYMKGCYEEFHALGRRKNKANSKPILFSPQNFLGVERPKSALRCYLVGAEGPLFIWEVFILDWAVGSIY